MWIFRIVDSKELNRQLPEKTEAIVRTRFRCHQAAAHGKAQYDELWLIVNGKVFVPSDPDLALFGVPWGRAQETGRSGIAGGWQNFGSEYWKEKATAAILKEREYQEKVKQARAREERKQRREQQKQREIQSLRDRLAEVQKDLGAVEQQLRQAKGEKGQLETFLENTIQAQRMQRPAGTQPGARPPIRQQPGGAMPPINSAQLREKIKQLEKTIAELEPKRDHLAQDKNQLSAQLDEARKE
jgi:hypothetical protein